jgi:hypothetical protein
MKYLFYLYISILCISPHLGQPSVQSAARLFAQAKEAQARAADAQAKAAKAFADALVFEAEQSAQVAEAIRNVSNANIALENDRVNLLREKSRKAKLNAIEKANLVKKVEEKVEQAEALLKKLQKNAIKTKKFALAMKQQSEKAKKELEDAIQGRETFVAKEDKKANDARNAALAKQREAKAALTRAELSAKNAAKLREEADITMDRLEIEEASG